MQLKSVKLAGFKSFADPTTIPVKSNMNGIVGPNGCGKSNVIDAVRWVIGETSAKQLRGQSMSDVIFSGTTSRKPVGKASVELLFDNNDGRIAGEYANFSQISIRREVTRDAQSNYFINGTVCRRRDIIDIFLGTGLGPRSYAVIEQGMISNLIEAKPEEMRAYIEEVAGISMYKARRRETENRMKRTHENLDRLNDLLSEIDKQLKHLDRQAQAAEKYKELKQQERELQSQIKVLHWQNLQQQMDAHNQVIEGQDLKREQLLAEQRHAETEIEKAKVQQADLTTQQNEVQKRFYSLGADIARLEQRIKHTQEQTTRWQTEFGEVKEFIDDIENNSGEYSDQIAELEDELERLQPQTENVDTVAAAAKENLRQAEAEMQRAQQQWETHQVELNQTQSQQQVTQTKLQYCEQQKAQLQQRLDKLTQQIDQAQLDELQQLIQPLSDQVNGLQARLDAVQQQLQSLSEQIQQQRQTNQTLNQNIQQTRKTLNSSEAKHASLEALQQAALGSDNETTQQWLTHQKLTDAVPLGKTLQVNSGWELAVETVLGDYLEALCVDDVAQYLDACTQLTEGQVTLLAKNKAQSSAVSANRLASEVQCDWPLPAMLSQVFTATDLAEARQLQSQLAEGESVITRDGLWMGTNWVRVAKKAVDQDSVLLREQKIKQLSEEIETQRAELRQLETQLLEGEQELQSLETQRDAEHETYQQQSRELTDLQAELSARQSRYDELSQQFTRVQQEQQECQQQMAANQTEQATTEETLQQVLERITALQQRQTQLSTMRESSQQALAEARATAQQEQQRADELGIRLSSNENQLQVLRQTMQRDERQLQQFQERHEELEANLADADGPLQTLNTELQSYLSQRSEVETQLHQVENELQYCVSQIETLENQRNSLQQTQANLQGELEKVRMERQAVSVRQTTIVEQLEEAQLNLDVVLTTLPEEANLKVWEENAERMATRIGRLGAINLAAIDEFKALTERKQYLDQQHEDLQEALTVLENAIRKIDRETRSKFKDTFDRVNAGFQALFPRIFGGGKATLELESEDLLSTGILIKAQPPGKKNATIHMLSGGEKALTAISLVFSLFQLNPAPFCILDEVDAPLDDLNVGRFCQLVHEMSEKVQFLVISHNKVTIEKCDHLMGVTMQEPGVSRLVAVDMEQAISMVDE